MPAAGMRIPRAHDTGLADHLPLLAEKLIDEGADEHTVRSKLNEVQKKQIGHYQKHSRIGVLLEDTNR